MSQVQPCNMELGDPFLITVGTPIDVINSSTDLTQESYQVLRMTSPLVENTDSCKFIVYSCCSAHIVQLICFVHFITITIGRKISATTIMKKRIRNTYRIS